MTQGPLAQLLRRDGLSGNSYLHKLAAIDVVFIIAFLVMSGFCVRVLFTGRGRRLPYALLLASSIFYTVFLSLDLVNNKPSANPSITEVIKLSDAMVFFLNFAFPALFFAIVAVFVKRRGHASEMTGGREEPASDAEILVVIVGVAMSVWLLISCLVFAGMSVWANALVLRINESAHSLSLEAVNGLLQESERRQLQVLNAGYVVAAARCSTCLFVSFVALHNHFKTRRFSYDEAAKWMAYLFPPLCLAYVVYQLWSTIVGSPGFNFKTLDDISRANIANTVLRAVIPFLMSLVLIVVGLKRSLWNRTLDSGFVKMHDWPTRKESDAKTIEA